MHLVWCSEKIISALTQLAGENRSKEAFLQAMRDATIGMTKLCGPSAPASVYTTLQQVWLQACRDQGSLCAYLKPPTPRRNRRALTKSVTQQTIT